MSGFDREREQGNEFQVFIERLEGEIRNHPTPSVLLDVLELIAENIHRLALLVLLDQEIEKISLRQPAAIAASADL